MRAPLALCLVEEPSDLDKACRFLSAAGFDVLGFDDGQQAAAWLEEETPAVALISGVPSADRSSIGEELSGRGVLVIGLADRDFQFPEAGGRRLSGPKNAW